MVKYEDLSYIDYSASPITFFEMSGARLIFRLPEDGSSKGEGGSQSLDVDSDIYERDSVTGAQVAVLSDNNINYFDKVTLTRVGRMNVNFALIRVPLKDRGLTSILNKPEFRWWQSQYFYESYEPENEDIRKSFDDEGRVIRNEDLYIYSCIEDIEEVELHGVTFFRGLEGHHETWLTHWFNAPIADEFYLSIRMRVLGFRDDYFDSKESQKNMYERLMQDFLEHVSLKLTPEAIEKIQRYNNAK
ncbi:hypothetical protein ONV78_28185 [Hahella sp. CR1]|uniref:hypothetical protein n=1 Tax=Hahella sp. CR1 TaxID=2992807 RepID=UPI002441D7EB|nr:hypothetical protein [Hahella sp. CR1]MDG9671648.1 hypothetical protein [Hahella sp. CR1]